MLSQHATRPAPLYSECRADRPSHRMTGLPMNRRHPTSTCQFLPHRPDRSFIHRQGSRSAIHWDHQDGTSELRDWGLEFPQATFDLLASTLTDTAHRLR